jgi:hypothetical protein
MQMFGNKARVVAYVDVDLFHLIEEQRKLTNESQSGFICGILEVACKA